MSSIHFSNYQIKEDTDYFIYIGELKNYGLNYFLKEALCRIYKRKFDFIAVVPDILEQYNYDNLIVINPLIRSYECRYGTNVHCRVSAGEFMDTVSQDPDIRSLIDTLLNKQAHIFLYMYESLTEMTLDTIKGVSILGPDKDIAKKVNNKSYQMEGLKHTVPVVDFKTCEGYQDLIATCDALWDSWSDGIFVTKEYSAAGINSVVAHSKADIENKFKNQSARYLITRFLPHTHDPTVLAVVANPEEIYIAGVADQCIQNGNRFTGSTFPSVLSHDQTAQLKTHTRNIGVWLAKQGYRGIYGCDYILTEDNDIRFLEINARKQGTTLEFCCTLEQSLPPRSPILPELEYYAVQKQAFPENTVEMEKNPHNLHWGTYNYKIHTAVRTRNYIPQAIGEREAFKKVAAGNLKKDFLILEHAGSDFVIAKGSFIARIVALGHDHSSVSQGIDQGCKTIELTFEKEQIPENNYAKS